MRSIAALVTLLCATLVAVPPAAAEDFSARPAPAGADRRVAKDALVGAWDLVLTFSDGARVKSTLTVAPGRRDGEGTVLHAAEASLLLPNPTTPEQGAWEYVRGQFLATYYGFAVDSAFQQPAGRIGFRHRISVSGDQETFVGEATFEVLDTNGVVVFTDRVRTEGTRQHAVAP